MKDKLLSASGNHWAHLGSELLSLTHVADIRIHVDNSDAVLTTSKILLGRVSKLLGSIFENEIMTRGESFSTTCYDLFIPGFEAETAWNALELIATGKTRITGINKIVCIKSFLEALRIQIDLELIPPTKVDFQAKESLSHQIPDIQKQTEKRKSGSIDEVINDEPSRFAKITDDKSDENVHDEPSHSRRRAKHRIGPLRSRRRVIDLASSDSSLVDPVSQRHTEEVEDARSASQTENSSSGSTLGSIAEPTRFDVSDEDVVFDVSDDDAEVSDQIADNDGDVSDPMAGQNTTNSVAAMLSSSEVRKNCPICHEDFFSKTELVRHIACLHYAEKIRQFHKGTRLDCGICKTHFTVQSNTLRHVVTAHNALNYISLDNPVMKSNRTKTLSCNVCRLNFRNRSLMLIHKAKLHFAAELTVMYGDTNWKCGLCGDLRTSEDSLILHLIKAHKMLNN